MTLSAAAEAIHKTAADKAASIAAFRATITAVSGPLVSIRREGEATGSSELYPSVTRSLLYVGDVVLCLPVGGKPVVLDKINRSAGTPTFAALASAGDTADTTGSAGTDADGVISIKAQGTGIAAGNILDLSFAAVKPNTNYRLLLTPSSTAARALGLVVGRSARATNKVTIGTATALTSGSTYTWDYNIAQYA